MSTTSNTAQGVNKGTISDPGQWLENLFTGNTDYQRQLELLGMTNDFNAAEALKQRNWEATQAALTRAFNASEAQKNRDYQTEMSNTQYQRMVSDMKAAGLNPYLAYGSHSSVPTGSTASAGTPSGSAARSGGASGAASGKGVVGDILSAVTRIAATAMSANAMTASAGMKLATSANWLKYQARK